MLPACFSHSPPRSPTKSYCITKMQDHRSRHNTVNSKRNQVKTNQQQKKLSQQTRVNSTRAMHTMWELNVFRALINSLVCWFSWPRSVSGLSIAFHLQNYDMKLLPSRRILCTPSNHAPCHVPSCKAIIHRLHACVAVTCQLHFWQNDLDLLLATAVTRGWKGYRDQSQHRILTPEKRNVPLFLQGL